MRVTDTTVAVDPLDGGVLVQPGPAGGRWRYRSGPLTLVGSLDDLEAFAAHLTGEVTAHRARRLVVDDAVVERAVQVRYDELVAGDRIADGPDAGRTVTDVWAPVAGHVGYGLVGLDSAPHDCWGRHVVWVSLPRPRPADAAAEAAVDAAAVWQDESTWHDVIVGDTVRLAGEWLTVMTVGPDRIRSGMTKVRLTDERGGVSVVSVEPADSVTVRYPRVAGQAVAS